MHFMERMVMGRKTQGVYDLVQATLQTLPNPQREDIIDEVCFAIEQSPILRKRYDELSADLRAWVVNNWIGQYVKQITGGQSIREVSAKRSKLITGYTKLSF
jgi:hypothetical protein